MREARLDLKTKAARHLRELYTPFRAFLTQRAQRNTNVVSQRLPPWGVDSLSSYRSVHRDKLSYLIDGQGALRSE